MATARKGSRRRVNTHIHLPKLIDEFDSIYEERAGTKSGRVVAV